LKEENNKDGKQHPVAVKIVLHILSINKQLLP
jgi:hypothetical protein